MLELEQKYAEQNHLLDHNYRELDLANDDTILDDEMEGVAHHYLDFQNGFFNRASSKDVALFSLIVCSPYKGTECFWKGSGKMTPPRLFLV